jgi:HK97 family phage prohead protease
MVFKNISESVIDVDDKSRRVKVAISEVGSKDLQNDVIDPGAYTKTIQERGPMGANLIWHLTDHVPMMKYAIGKFSNLEMEGNKLVGTTDIPNTSYGNDMMEFYKNGMINQHSIGFQTMRSEIMDQGTKDEYTIIKEIKLYEGSAVLWGANPNTPTISVGKSIDEVIGQKNKLYKLLKKGNFTDTTAELIEMHIEYLAAQEKELLQIPTNAEDTKASPSPGNKSNDLERLKLLLTI